MIIKIQPEDTGKYNYTDPFNCPIAQGLKNEGFKNVSCAHDWIGYKLDIKYNEKIHHLAKEKALFLSKNKQDKEIKLNLSTGEVVQSKFY